MALFINNPACRAMDKHTIHGVHPWTTGCGINWSFDLDGKNHALSKHGSNNSNLRLIVTIQ